MTVDLNVNVCVCFGWEETNSRVLGIVEGTRKHQRNTDPTCPETAGYPYCRKTV